MCGCVFAGRLPFTDWAGTRLSTRSKFRRFPSVSPSLGRRRRWTKRAPSLFADTSFPPFSFSFLHFFLSFLFILPSSSSHPSFFSKKSYSSPFHLGFLDFSSRCLQLKVLYTFIWCFRNREIYIHVFCVLNKKESMFLKLPTDGSMVITFPSGRSGWRPNARVSLPQTEACSKAISWSWRDIRSERSWKPCGFLWLCKRFICSARIIK